MSHELSLHVFEGNAFQLLHKDTSHNYFSFPQPYSHLNTKKINGQMEISCYKTFWMGKIKCHSLEPGTLSTQQKNQEVSQMPDMLFSQTTLLTRYIYHDFLELTVSLYLEQKKFLNADEESFN